MQNPPIKPSEFEEEVRRSVIAREAAGRADRLDHGRRCRGRRRVQPAQREGQARRASRSRPTSSRTASTVSDAEIASHFEANKEKYRIPEKRKIKYALIDLQGIRQRIDRHRSRTSQRYYEDNQQQYATPEQVRASHILLKTEGKDDAAVKKQAEDVLAKVKGGADFAALAEEDLGGRSQRGQGRRPRLLRQARRDGEGVRRRGVRARSRARRAALVKSQFGYHIIQAHGEAAGDDAARSTKSRPQIEEMLKSERAQKEAERISTELAGKLTKPEDLDTVAKGRGLTVGETRVLRRATNRLPASAWRRRSATARSS